eukprot:463449_1
MLFVITSLLLILQPTLSWPPPKCRWVIDVYPQAIDICVGGKIEWNDGTSVRYKYACVGDSVEQHVFADFQCSYILDKPFWVESTITNSGSIPKFDCTLSHCVDNYAILDVYYDDTCTLFSSVILITDTCFQITSNVWYMAQNTYSGGEIVLYGDDTCTYVIQCYKKWSQLGCDVIEQRFRGDRHPDTVCYTESPTTFASINPTTITLFPTTHPSISPTILPTIIPTVSSKSP